MKRDKIHGMPKRTTFLRLFLKAVCVSLVCTLIFAHFYRELLSYKIRNDIEQWLSDNSNHINTYFNEHDADKDGNSLSGDLSLYTYYCVTLDDIINSDEPYEISSKSGGADNFAMSALEDKNGNIIAASREQLVALLVFGKAGNKDNGIYVCDPQLTDIPEVQKIYDDNYEWLGKIKNDTCCDVSLDIDSAYVDKKTHTFIPHEADMLFENYVRVDIETEPTCTKHISITVDDDRYELVSFRKNEISKVSDDEIYPRSILSVFCGTPCESFDNNFAKFRFDDENERLVGWCGDMYDFEYGMKAPVYINDEEYTMDQYFHFSAKGTVAEKFYRLGIIAFGTASVLLALLWAWQKNVRNKAHYAFEDYQRDLTDHLAHDIKTPLMAISGYAENVLNGKLTQEEQTEYLNSILDNVSYTDSLISRTLYLNHADRKRSSKEKIKLNETAEDILAKYKLMLHEKNIVYSVSGNAEVNTDKTAMETILENLISNAVKYTPNEGTVRITIDKKHITVVNSVSEKIDTKELKRPFVRGDAARSNADGNGLGLAIAERAAIANGYKLMLSCTDKEFKAEVKF